ncbi:polysaccharide deacetylase family sporulation protein PdaB [Oceanobacillus piezotolerans]|uniref:Polysaccharide deacetylase family sporulation protein PdaB n=1 Tax=Oceanobacillus piezotolerans TaxID=2448030 RepID=A0A498D113_9BACI|nr:polysaccharide deacetylase family sporulation protein PdaB [Oceanobacillus piezotolerans]RLL39954.1 polysaccharide deacetylase family sporulation protein PdaB [Oceanobacillus piezotolerans]
MKHFHVISFTKFKRWLLISGLAFLTAFVIWIGNNGIVSIFSNDNPVALSKGNANEPNIALTFNISWGEERVHEILDKLSHHQVQATFFVSGEWAERHPSILEKISEGDHELGMLGYRYTSYLEQELDQVRRDLAYADEIFNKLGYEDITLLRPPHGHFNEEILSLAKDMNYQVIHWNINTNDWENPGKQAIIDKTMKDTNKGDIILMHASDSAKQTADALDTILPGLKNKGFHFVPMTELINQAHAEAKLVE